MYERTPKYLYTKQKCRSRERGIEFNLTFDQWLKTWEDALGNDWMSKRGKGFGKFCMARCNDKGAYEIGNIKIITIKSNGEEMAGRSYYRIINKTSLSDKIKMWRKEFQLCDYRNQNPLWYLD